LKYYDIDNVLLLGTNLWHSDTLLKLAKKDAQDAIVTDSFFAESDSPHVKQFVSDYQSVYGEEPGYIEAVVYDSANLTIKALKDYEIYSREEFRDALSDIHNYQGVTGKTSFLENGDVDKEIFYLKVYRNRFHEVKPELFDGIPEE